MYHHSSSRNSSTQGYYYTEHQYSPETNETPAYGAPNYRPASPQSQNYYNYASIPQQFSSGYSVVPPSSPPPRSYTATPLAIAHQTDQTLTALASARRLSREYMKESSSPASRSSYYEAPSQHQSRIGDPSSAYTMRSPRLGTAPPSTSMGNPKPVEGHACRCCGKVFGRPSALKIHMAIHTGEKAYICPEAGCHRCFSVRSNMSRHIRNVHQIWPDGREEASDSSGDEAEER